MKTTPYEESPTLASPCPPTARKACVFVSSPLVNRPIPPTQLVAGKPLSKKEKLLEAVMKVGPLLLTGLLHQWQHPHLPLDSFDRVPTTSRSLPLSSHLLHKDSPISINAWDNNNNCCTIYE
ncbi:hypothetical protein HHK36_009535 [Tetracentron sinense]|uniref:Uncharacterized protein n=1 Tax=Tetracentron sinense TaxID=13715 RepID=A0A834ZLI4_TETSI|nr:hypothetical protein HHK36_009535 [Tetracentron sinense]